MATNAQRSLDSRRALIDAGRALFGEHGYADTSTPMIAGAAGVSRGALYHHFEDKQALFRAVIQDAYESIEAEIENSAFGAGDPLEALIEGGESFISAISDPVLRRILLVDGPA
ncbi:MAG: TetR/AcrR family transcriptional regulator, partial [Pseudomonadota bacterium]